MCQKYMNLKAGRNDMLRSSFKIFQRHFLIASLSSPDANHLKIKHAQLLLAQRDNVAIKT